MVVEILARVDLDGVSINKVSNAVGHVAWRRHRTSQDQNRNQRNALSQRRFNFKTYRIGFISEPVACGVRPDPLRSDDSQHDVALGKRLANVRAEIDPERNIIDIAKDRVTPEMGDQPIKDAAGNNARVLAAIRNSYSRHSLILDSRKQAMVE